MNESSFDGRARALLARFPAALRERHIAAAQILHLPANEPPWTDTGLPIRAGDEVTVFAAGRVVLAESLDLWGSPRLFLWGRFAPGGSVWNGAQDTMTVRADRDGRLELGICQGEWSDASGALATPREAYVALQGGYDVLAIRWRGTAAAGLDALHAAAPDEALIAAERTRLAHPIVTPDGWEYLWFLGPAEIYRRVRATGNRDAIAVHAANDLGILRRPVEFALSPDARLTWSWCVDALPTTRAEDTLPTHDYVSIALEFDNGLDLTWTWSAALPVDHHYACPLPHWNARETHWVVRSGSDELGVWQDESRAILADYATAVSGPQPTRVVAVWLIAVSVFGHGTAAAEFANIGLDDGRQRIAVR